MVHTQISNQPQRVVRLFLGAWLILASSPPSAASPDVVALSPTATLPRAAHVVLDARQVRVTPTLAFVEGYRALGCFEDAGILTATSRFNGDMTPHNCRNWCSVASAPVFGIKMGGQCFCGTRIEPFAEKADEAECTRACFGASSLLCGAANRLNLYAPTDMNVGTFADNAPVVTGSDGSGNAAATGTITTTGSGSGSSSGPDGGNTSQDTTSPGGAGLSAGAIAGIALGAAVLSSVVTAAIILFVCRRRRGSTASSSSQPMGYSASAEPPLSSITPGGYGNYKPPHTSSVTQSHSLSPDTAAHQPQYGRHELNAQQYAGSYEMPGHTR